MTIICLLVFCAFACVYTHAQDDSRIPASLKDKAASLEEELPESMKDKLKQLPSLKKRLRGASKNKRITNGMSGTFISKNKEGNALSLVDKAKKDKALAERLIEPAVGDDRFTQIRNPETGARIHVEWSDVAEAAKHWDGAHAVMWIPEEADGGTYFLNRWKRKYLTYQNGQLTLSASKSPNALWKIDNAPEGFGAGIGGKIFIGLVVLVGLVVVGGLYSILT